MTPLDIGIAGIAALFIVMFIGMPIGLSMGVVGLIGLFLVSGFDATLIRLGHTAFNQTASYLQLCLPLYVLMGEFAFASKITTQAYTTAYKWLGNLPGGLGMATIGACAIFAAVCGSSVATATTIGASALPEMRKYKYSNMFATGTIAAGGTLGILIPPSMGFILYGLITEQSIGKLYLAGVVPGILLAFMFIVTIFFWSIANPNMAPRGQTFTWKERILSLKDIWAVVLLFIIVIGGIYSGIFNTTESGAVGALAACVIGLSTRRLNGRTMTSAIMITLKTTGMMFILLICASLFSYLMTVSGLTRTLANWVISLSLPPLMVIVVILLLIVILGCLMEVFTMMLISVPIFFPIIVGMGFNPIWFGVLIVVTLELGLILPPLGMNVFVINGIAKDVPLYTIFKGITPFAIAMIACLALLIAFPSISLVLMPAK